MIFVARKKNHVKTRDCCTTRSYMFIFKTFKNYCNPTKEGHWTRQWFPLRHNRRSLRQLPVCKYYAWLGYYRKKWGNICKWRYPNEKSIILQDFSFMFTTLQILYYLSQLNKYLLYAIWIQKLYSTIYKTLSIFDVKLPKFH